MKGKIIIEAVEEPERGITVVGEMEHMNSTDKLALVDGLLMTLELNSLDTLVLVSMIIEGKIGKREAPGKTVISADKGMIDKILKEKGKQTPDGD